MFFYAAIHKTDPSFISALRYYRLGRETGTYFNGL
jgi:hypothetical protein